MILIQIQLLFLAVCYIFSKYLFNTHVFIFEDILILLTGWVISIFLTHKHKPKYYQIKVKYILAPFLKGYFIQLLFLLLGILFINKARNDWNILLTSIFIYGVFEYLFMLFWLHIYLEKKNTSLVKASITKYDQTDLDLKSSSQPKRIPADLLKIKLSDGFGEIISSLYNTPDVKQFSDGGTNDFFVGKLEHINQLSATNLSLIILYTRVNDLGDINKVFKKCYDSLLPGGYLIVRYNNISDTNYMLKKQYPSIFYYLVYPFHWLFYRVLSKLSTFVRIQEWISKGKNKVISWVEIFGRLAYCGLDVELDERYNGLQYIIARKTKTISDNPNPSFYIFIKLNRVSLYGNIVKINKVRSMYPYSEFLQKKIFELNSVGNGGKFNDDPRITPQGRIFRKYWIDELPQFFDWIRGEIKLVGIRAMSQHFFSLYSQRYKDLYLQVKPGIISPIFDETNDTFNDIERIEYEYLRSYSINPIKTDWKYFWLTFKNILNGVRSK